MSACAICVVVLAAPLAGYIPLAALAGLLATVAWGMAERHAVASLLKASRADAVVLRGAALACACRAAQSRVWLMASQSGSGSLAVSMTVPSGSRPR